METFYRTIDGNVWDDKQTAEAHEMDLLSGETPGLITISLTAKTTNGEPLGTLEATATFDVLLQKIIAILRPLPGV